MFSNHKDTLKQDKYEEYLTSLTISKEPPQNSHLFDAEIRQIFKLCDDFTYREILLGQGKKVIVYFLQGIVDLDLLQISVVKPLLETRPEIVEDPLQSIDNPKNTVVKKWGEVIFALFDGGAICHIDGQFPVEVKVPGKEKRNIAEPTSQYQIFGPKVGFIEDIQTNISLMRKLVKDPRLKTKNYEIGSLTHTKVTLMYIEGYADNSYLRYLDKKIRDVEIDQLVTLGQLNKKIIDNPKSIFPQVFGTERPDNVALALGEGKVAIFIDNVTFASVLPVSLFELYLVGDDHSFSSIYNAIFLRVIRYLCMVLSTALPALYVSLVAFHPELIPETLALTIAESRSQIPFPAAAEALIMMIALDVLVEASTRLPSFVGQTIGIVGGLVIGTAAVEAGVVSSLMVIVIAFTAIASFTTPTWEMVSSLRVIRYGFLIISSLFGLYGFVLGFCLTFIHICNLETHSRPYISPLSPMKMTQLYKKAQEFKGQLQERGAKLWK